MMPFLAGALAGAIATVLVLAHLERRPLYPTDVPTPEQLEILDLQRDLTVMRSQRDQYRCDVFTLSRLLERERTARRGLSGDPVATAERILREGGDARA